MKSFLRFTRRWRYTIMGAAALVLALAVIALIDWTWAAHCAHNLHSTVCWLGR